MNRPRVMIPVVGPSQHIGQPSSGHPSAAAVRRAQLVQAIERPPIARGVMPPPVARPPAFARAVVADDFGRKEVLRQRMGLGARGSDQPEERPLTGAGLNNRGANVTLNPGDQNVVIAQTPLHAGNDAEMLTIAVGLNTQGFVPPSGTIKPPIIVGHLTWGVGGASYETVDFDVTQGTVLQVPASFAKVSCDYNTYAGGGDFPPAVISASFGYGMSGSRYSAPRRSIFFSAAPSSFSVPAVIPIPPFARSLSVLGTAGALGANLEPNLTIQVAGFGTIATGVAQFFLKAAEPGNMNDGVFPIPLGMSNVAIFNNDAVHAFNGWAVFQLAL